MLKCIDADGYTGRGSVTCARYKFVQDEVRYVDKRDLPQMPREKFEKV